MLPTKWSDFSLGFLRGWETVCSCVLVECLHTANADSSHQGNNGRDLTSHICTSCFPLKEPRLSGTLTDDAPNKKRHPGTVRSVQERAEPLSCASLDTVLAPNQPEIKPACFLGPMTRLLPQEYTLSKIHLLEILKLKLHLLMSD